MSPDHCISCRALSAAACLANGRHRGFILMSRVFPVSMWCWMSSVQPTPSSDFEKQSLNSRWSYHNSPCSQVISSSLFFYHTSLTTRTLSGIVETTGGFDGPFGGVEGGGGGAIGRVQLVAGDVGRNFMADVVCSLSMESGVTEKQLGCVGRLDIWTS